METSHYILEATSHYGATPTRTSLTSLPMGYQWGNPVHGRMPLNTPCFHCAGMSPTQPKDAQRMPHSKHKPSTEPRPQCDTTPQARPHQNPDVPFELVDYKSVRTRPDVEGPENDRVFQAMSQAAIARDYDEAARLLRMALIPAQALRAIKLAGGAEFIREQGYRTDLAEQEYGPDWLDRPNPTPREIYRYEQRKRKLLEKQASKSGSNTHSADLSSTQSGQSQQMPFELVDFKSVRTQAEVEGPENDRVFQAMSHAAIAKDHEEIRRLQRMALIPAQALRAIKLAGGAEFIREQGYRTDLAEQEYGPDWLDRPNPTPREIYLYEQRKRLLVESQAPSGQINSCSNGVSSPTPIQPDLPNVEQLVNDDNLATAHTREVNNDEPIVRAGKTQPRP